MGLLILRHKDSGTRNCFLGETSGPYIWGKEKHTPGSRASQGVVEEGVGSLRGLDRIWGFTARLKAGALPRILVRFPLLAQDARNGASGLFVFFPERLLGSSWKYVAASSVKARNTRSLDFARDDNLRERLRCLRTTGLLGLAEGGGGDGAHGSPDSATQRFWNAKLLPWGKFGALHLGEGEMYSGEFGASRAADRSVRPTRADCWLPAGPESGLWLGGMAEAVPFPNLSNSNPMCFASAGSTEILRWESLAFARDSAASG